MKRFFAFKGDCYYPSAAMGDFVGDFDTVDDAVCALTYRYMTSKAWDDAMQWACIWDSETRAEVWSDAMLPTAS